LSNLKRKNGASIYDSDYYDEDEVEDYENDMEIRKINSMSKPNNDATHAASSSSAAAVEEEDDYDYDNDLVIEGNIGEIPYRLYEIDIEPSELWTRPPVGPLDPPSFNPAMLLSQLSSSSDTNNNSDQECDPRIKYYANKANANNVSNFQQLLIQQQQQQQTPGSPSASSSISVPVATTTTTTNTVEPTTTTTTTTTTTAAKTLPPVTTSTTTNAKPNRADPRLMSRTLNSNNLSPTRSISPPTTTVVEPTPALSKNDLISIKNRQVSENSLLSSLPDFQFPKENQPKNLANGSIGGGSGSSLSNSLQMQSLQEPNTVKLSIADYKRKLQKPNSSTSSNTTSSASITTSTSTSQLIMNTFLSNTLNSSSSLLNSNSNTSTNNNNTSTNSNGNNSTVTSSLPSIPSYSVNLQAPQSLHELFRNFQS